MATILCIDPNLEILESNKAVLESVGYRVLTASDESTGIALTRRNSFDAAVFHFNMPGMEADPIVEVMMKEHPTLPIVMLSGHPDAIPESLRWFADAVLQTADGPDVLLSTMARLIGKATVQKRLSAHETARSHERLVA
jgi:two-component system cell cycle sensor histidine kinase/response regulator CckA